MSPSVKLAQRQERQSIQQQNAVRICITVEPHVEQTVELLRLSDKFPDSSLNSK